MSSRAATAFILLLALGTLPLFGETTEILATGPDKGSGIRYLGPNVIPYLTVTYESAQAESGGAARSSPQGGAGSGQPAGTGGQGSARTSVRLLYTSTEVVAYTEWKPAPCGSYRTLSVRTAPPVLYYHSPQGWSLFFAFADSYQKPCAFVSTFLERFAYFLGITQENPLSSFPAVLKLP